MIMKNNLLYLSLKWLMLLTLLKSHESSTLTSCGKPSLSKVRFSLMVTFPSHSTISFPDYTTNPPQSRKRIMAWEQPFHTLNKGVTHKNLAHVFQEQRINNFMPQAPHACFLPSLPLCNCWGQIDYLIKWQQAMYHKHVRTGKNI